MKRETTRVPQKVVHKRRVCATGQEENLKKKIKNFLPFSGQATTEAARPHEQEYRCMSYSYEQHDSQQYSRVY
jgi:hypothetical protein